MSASHPSQARFAVLLTCHDRRALTLACLDRLAEQTIASALDVFLVDDGSTDGTGSAVAAAHPHVTVVTGDGSLWWNGGMRLAWRAAVDSGVDHRGYIWLNDDVELDADALARLVDTAGAVVGSDGAAVVAGSTVDGATGAPSYGGSVRATPRRPLRLELVRPGDTARPVDTVSGNIVLVTRAAHRRLGSLDPRYEHIYGDLDYGFRAGKAGVPVILAAGVLGRCDANSTTGGSLDRTLGRAARLRLRWREERSRHSRDWRRFARRWSGLGPLSALYALSPYLRIMARPRRSGS